MYVRRRVAAGSGSGTGFGQLASGCSPLIPNPLCPGDAGKYASTNGSSACDFCNTGGESAGFSSDSGSSWCNLCETGYYRKDAGGKTAAQLLDGGGDECGELGVGLGWRCTMRGGGAHEGLLL